MLVTYDAPLKPVELPSAAWEKVSIDTVGPFETAPANCRYAITLVDYFSKWPEVAFSPRVDTAAVIQFLTSVFAREGNPKELVSDKEPLFISSEFLRERDIRHFRSAVYHSHANGEVERFNRVLKTVCKLLQFRESLGNHSLKHSL